MKAWLMMFLLCFSCLEAKGALPWQQWQALEQQAIEAMVTRPSVGKEQFLELAKGLKAALVTPGVSESEAATLHYNLGNIYHWLGDEGRSVLNYRRCEEKGGVARLQENLWSVRSERIDRLPHSFGPAWLRWLRETRQQIPGLTFLSVLAWFAMLVAPLMWMKRGRFPVMIFASASVVFCLSTTVAVFPLWLAEQRSEMVVTGDEVLLRKGPGLIYGAALDQPLHGGTELMLLDERRDWKQVELSDGRRGWAYRRGLSVVNNDVGFGSQRFAVE
jgi:hypothetical protein